MATIYKQVLEIEISCSQWEGSAWGLSFMGDLVFFSFSMYNITYKGGQTEAFQGLFVGEFTMFQKYWWWTNQCGSLWGRQSKTVDAPPIRWASMSRLGPDFSLVWGVGEVRTWRNFRSRGFVLSHVPNNVQNGVRNVFSILFSTCSPSFATYSMYCSYRPHFIPYSLPKVIIFLFCIHEQIGKIGLICRSGESPKFWNLCFQSVISLERFFLEGSINEDYLEKQKKKLLHSGPVFSFLAKFLHFSTKKLGIVLEFFFLV